jgi:hypothetical protein
LWKPHVNPKAPPKPQHLRRFADDRWDTIKKELAKLLAAGFICEVFHPEWLANPVLVRKKNTNEWRMFIDYTDLNKHCPKDPFRLPQIDQVIDSTVGYDLLFFLECYSCYHQITIKEENQEKTAFITPFGAYYYYYNTMSFGLNNASATYQRAIQACFKKQLKPMWMMWLSRSETSTRSSPILNRLSHLCKSSNGSSIPTSVPSAYHLGNYSASLSAIAASKPILRRFSPSPT